MVKRRPPLLVEVDLTLSCATGWRRYCAVWQSSTRDLSRSRIFSDQISIQSYFHSRPRKQQLTRQGLFRSSRVFYCFSFVAIMKCTFW